MSNNRDYPRIVVPPPGPKARAIVERQDRFASTSYPKEYPLAVARGQGPMVEDVDGNRFLDFMAGIAVADWAIAHVDTTDTLRSVRALRFGGTPEQVPERYTTSSPITYAEKVEAPVLIMQGRNDTRTPPRSIEMYENKMKSLGKDIEVRWFDAGHGSLSVEQNIEFQELMLRFAYRILSSKVS